MKIVHISTLDSGGAAQSAIRLHQGLLEIGVDSRLLTLYKSRKGIPNHFLYEQSKNHIFHKIRNSITYRVNEVKKKRLQSYFVGNQKFSGLSSIFHVESHSQILDCDVINLHWVADFIDLKSFFSRVRKPVVWTLHDMQPFSPGYHYRTGFDFKGNTHILETYSYIKQQIFKDFDPLEVVSPSKWLLDESQNSSTLGFKKHHLIPYGIDTSIFTQLSETHAKKHFGFEEKDIVLLYLANNIDNPLKGFDIFLKCLQSLEKNKNSYKFLIVGDLTSEVKWELDSTGFELKLKGQLSDPLEISLAFNASNLYLMPSIEDNFPNSILESLCCGVPVLAFKTGGMKDMIIESENGFLVDSINDTEYCGKLGEILSSRIWERLSREKISKEATKKYNLAKQASRYKDLYTQISNRSGPFNK